MAGISTKGMYGLAAMYYLYQNDTGSPLQIANIATNANIPQNYLEQILLELRKSGLLSSIRGAKGGYILTDKGRESTVLDIIEVLEGEMCKLDCKTNSSMLAFFWESTTLKIKEVFDIKLKNLQNMEHTMQEHLNYVI
ncbi:MAG: Rrf2 family transcriptional regulator [Arcobacteraceae bacterium]|nr:Rrf2 family transcriptional regulator [Arcobacteraceae bacterium]